MFCWPTDGPEGAGGETTLDTTTLFVANIVILWVMALALGLAGWRRPDERWWRSWVGANLVLGAALAVFLWERHLPPLLVAILPNGLLILGLALRWRAAREFGNRPAHASIVWVPLALFAACAAPFAGVSYAAVFILTNVLLFALAGAAAWEFWRDRADGLPSRYGLIVAYAVMAASFGSRILLGLFDFPSMANYLPLDAALVVHLTVALFHTVASGAFALSIAYERNNAQLRHAASHDALSELLNRGAFEATVRAMLAGPRRGPFTLAILDIDHFKKINDRHGHAAGDAAIRHCAAICRDIAAETCTVARIGGEEFAMILREGGPTQAADTVERIRATVAASPVSWRGASIGITLSAGICYSSAAPDDFDELMRLADAGLYKAKNGGRNCVKKMAA